MFTGYLYRNLLANLRHNLKPDNGMEATISGISGVVEIEEFSVYNCFYNIDKDGNRTDFRIVKYTRTDSGGWMAYPYTINSTVTVHNSFDHTETVVSDTSISANLKFNIVESSYVDWLMPGMTPQDDIVKSVNYQRIIDITDR